MQYAGFYAKTDLEIGDIVRTLSPKPKYRLDKIEDIRTIHYLKDKKVEFEFFLSNLGRWVKREEILKRVI